MFRNVLRGAVVFLIGIALVVWSDRAAEFLIKILGILLILSGVISVVYGLATNSFENLRGLSIISLASVVLFLIAGIAMLVKTSVFINMIGFIFGIILAMYGLLQIIHTVRFSKGIRERFWFFLAPALIFAAGVALCFFTEQSTKLLSIIFGACLMLLGLADIMFSVKVNAFAKRIQRAAQEKANYESGKNIVVEPIEPEPDSVGSGSIESDSVGSEVVESGTVGSGVVDSGSVGSNAVGSNSVESGTVDSEANAVEPT